MNDEIKKRLEAAVKNAIATALETVSLEEVDVRLEFATATDTVFVVGFEIAVKESDLTPEHLLRLQGAMDRSVNT